MAKIIRYTVTCTRPVANEMARYEGSNIVSSQIVKHAPDWADESDKELFALYKFTFEVDSRYHVPARWYSFGVAPRTEL
jgi:hypothetical protein